MRCLIVVFSLVLVSCNSNKNVLPNNHRDHSHYNETSNSHTDYFDSYTLKDDDYGTSTIVTVKNETRTMVTSTLPNHKTEAFPRKGNLNTISAQNRTYTFLVNPKYTGKPKWYRELGVALNGVKFEPGIAAVVECGIGENYRVEAFQNTIDLGLDFNNAHGQPTGAYHYHGAPTSVIESLQTREGLVHIGFAHDGFSVYYSKSSQYELSYKV
jgi:hypothetical protein